MEMLVHLLLFSGLCSFTLSIQRGYILIQEKKTWDEAQAYCRENHIDLATVLSDEDRIDLLTAEPTLTSAWIGLYGGMNNWQWSYNNKSVSFVNWKTGEPDNAGGNDNCAVMKLGKWLDWPCGDYRTTLCYNERETGANRFVFYQGNWITRDQAQSYCRQYYTDLAIIESQADNDLLASMVPWEWEAWIGLHKVEQVPWKWSDASVSTFNINWMMGQPDGSGTGPLCGAAGPDGRIDDQPCSNAFPFICMHNSTKQIVRVEVKYVPNLNDPAMLENILQWIKQKMKDLGGEENIRWKMQPDGNVFLPKHE